MKVYPLRDAQQRMIAFEVEAAAIGRHGLCDVIPSIPGAKLTRRPRFLSRLREDDFCGFEIEGVRFHAHEPFGDTSRYWLGPNDARWHIEIEAVFATFADAPERNRSKPYARVAAIAIVVAYLLANAASISWTPAAEPLELRVEVVDERDRPLGGALVATVDRSPNGRKLTDVNGRTALQVAYRPRQLWAYPPIHSTDFDDQALRIEAPGREPAIVELDDALGALPERTHSADVRLRAGPLTP